MLGRCRTEFQSALTQRYQRQGPPGEGWHESVIPVLPGTRELAASVCQDTPPQALELHLGLKAEHFLLATDELSGYAWLPRRHAPTFPPSSPSRAPRASWR